MQAHPYIILFGGKPSRKQCRRVRRRRLPFSRRRARCKLLTMGAHVDDSSLPPIRFETRPDLYRHWRLELPPEHSGAVARLVLDVREADGLRPGYPLKLNSYHLAVDTELA